MKDTAALKRALIERPGQIWIPPGHNTRWINPNIGPIQRALTEYDPDLLLGRHEESGTWAVYTKRSPAGWGDVPYPIYNLGGELPGDPGKVIYEIQKRDLVRQGDKVIRDINEHNDKIKQEYEDAASEGSWMGAEALEWGFRKMGAHPSPRVFVPATPAVERMVTPETSIILPGGKEG